MEKVMKGARREVGEDDAASVGFIVRDALFSASPESRPSKVLDFFKTYFADNINFYNHIFDRREEAVSDLAAADRAIKYLVRMLRTSYLGLPGGNESEHLWEFNRAICLVLKQLPIENKVFGYYFPMAKNEILRLIIADWNTAVFDDHSKEIFLFLWDRCSVVRLEAERRIIRELLRGGLEGAAVDSINRWIQWIDERQIESESYLHDDISRLFAIARARAGGFKLACEDVRNAKIVEELGSAEKFKDEKLFGAMRIACGKVKKIGDRFFLIADSLTDYLGLQPPSERIYLDFISEKAVSMFINYDRNWEEKRYQEELEKVEKWLRESDQCFDLRHADAVLVSGHRVSLTLFICDKNEKSKAVKSWPIKYQEE